MRSHEQFIDAFHVIADGAYILSDARGPAMKQRESSDCLFHVENVATKKRVPAIVDLDDDPAHLFRVVQELTYLNQTEVLHGMTT